MWTKQMETELRTLFDSVVRKPNFCTHEEIRTIATRVGEQTDDLDDYIDLLTFDPETNLLSWKEFYKWWSEEVDPRDFEVQKS